MFSKFVSHSGYDNIYSSLRTALDISVVIQQAACKTGEVIRETLSEAAVQGSGSPVCPLRVAQKGRIGNK